MINLLIPQLLKQSQMRLQTLRRAVERLRLQQRFFDATLDEFLGFEIQVFGCEAVEGWDCFGR